MIIDSKGKLFGKISVIDILIVAVVLAAALGLVYKFKVSKTESIFTKPDTIQLVIYTEEAPDYTAADIKKGDIVKDPVKNAVFGKVIDVKVDKSVSFAQTDSGDIVVSSRPGYVSIKVYVEGKGILSASGATFDNADYSIGKAFEVRAGRSTLWAKISEFKKIKG
jgi:hypothetical protein